jgi:low temperature requirement protein LtrA
LSFWRESVARLDLLCQFDERGFYRLMMPGVMFGMIVLALTVPEALQNESAQFATVYAALRFVIVGLYHNTVQLKL